MNNSAMKEVSVKALRTEGSGLLKDNWVRAFAVFTSRVLGVSIYIMFNNLIITLVSRYFSEIGLAEPIPSVANWPQYAAFRSQHIFVIQDAVAIVLAAFYFMFISPLVLGCVRWYHSLAQCDNLQVGQIFHFYRGNDRFREALVFELNRLERQVAAVLMCFTPAAACFGAGAYFSTVPERAQLTMPLFIAGAALVFVGLIAYGFWITRFFLAKYLMVSERKMDVHECFKTSVTYMKGLHGKVIKVFLSYIPMFLTCILLAPAFMVFPAYDSTMAALALDIIDSRTYQ